MTTTDFRDRQRRIAVECDRNPDADLATIEAEVDAALVAEAEAAAEGQAWVKERTDSYDDLTTCGARGCTAAIADARTGTCGSCSVVYRQFEAESIGADLLSGGSTRRDAVGELFESRRKEGA
jgi:hypothetical protein